MKLFMTTIAAALIGTTAFAGNSDRYNDLRLNTQKTADMVYGRDAQSVETDGSGRAEDLRLDTSKQHKDDMSLSSRNAAKSAGEGFLYGGFGPGNDSR